MIKRIENKLTVYATLEKVQNIIDDAFYTVFNQSNNKTFIIENFDGDKRTFKKSNISIYKVCEYIEGYIFLRFMDINGKWENINIKDIKHIIDGRKNIVFNYEQLPKVEIKEIAIKNDKKLCGTKFDKYYIAIVNNEELAEYKGIGVQGEYIDRLHIPHDFIVNNDNMNNKKENKKYNFLGLAINKKHINKIAKTLNVTKEDVLYNIEFIQEKEYKEYSFEYVVKCRGVHALHNKEFNQKLVFELYPKSKAYFLCEFIEPKEDNKINDLLCKEESTIKENTNNNKGSVESMNLCVNYSILKNYRKNIKSIQDKIYKNFIENNNTKNSNYPTSIYLELNFINESIKSCKKENIEKIKYNLHSINYDCRRLSEIFCNTKYSTILQKIVDQLTEIENYIVSTKEYKKYLDEEYDELYIPF